MGREWEGLEWMAHEGRGVGGGGLEILHKALEQGKREGEEMLETLKGDGGMERGEEQGRELRTGELAPGRGEVGGRQGKGGDGSVGREGRFDHESGTWLGRAAAGSPRRAARTSPG